MSKINVCKRMCSECPFSNNSAAGWLGPYDTPKELHIFVMSEQPFPCHKKQDKSLKSSEIGTKRYPLCRGALIYMKRNAKRPKNPVLRAAFQHIGESEKEKSMWYPELKKHHSLDNHTKETVTSRKAGSHG